MVARASNRDVPVFLDGLGNAVPLVTVTVRPQVDGPLTAISFQEGQQVKKGDLLARIDPRPFSIQLHQAQAALARDQAQAKNAKVNLTRYTALHEQGLATQEQLDDQRATADQLAGTIKSDEAQIENAQLQLTYTEVRSPVDGVTGVRQIDQGNVVHASDANGIVVVTQLDPMAIVFTLPQDNLPQINREIAGGLQIEAYSRDGDRLLGRGKLSLVDNQVSLTTATIRLKGIVPNPDKALWPNEFVRARLLLATRTGALSVPAPAVQRGPQGTFVYVVTAGSDRRAAPGRGRDRSRSMGGDQEGHSSRRSGRRRRPESTASRRQSGAARERRRPSRRGLCARQRQQRSRPGSGCKRKARRSPAVSISEPFIRRPVATTLLVIGILIAGIVAFRALPVSALPQVDYPTIVVSTLMPGASAQTMSATVTTPLERQFGQMPALSQMTSVSSFGSSQITLQFTLDRNIDAAEQDVQAAINAAANLLPQTLPTPPTYSKSNPADTPILTLSVSSDTLALSQVSDYADSILAQKISQVSGVGLVTLNGGAKPAVRVQVDPEALAGTGLSLEDVRAAVVAANVNQPKGTLDGPRQSYTIATDDQLFKAEAFRPLILAYKNGAPIRLRDVASVEDGVENSELAGWADDKRADHPERAAPARRERDRGRRSGQGAAAPAGGVPAVEHSDQGAERPHRDRARVGRGRGVHAAAHDRPGRRGDLRVLAQRARDGHSRAWPCRCR